MQWRADKPTKPGLYLRADPPTDGLVLEAFIGTLDNLRWLNCRLMTTVPMDEVPAHFLWFGPIPHPCDDGAFASLWE